MSKLLVNRIEISKQCNQGIGSLKDDPNILLNAYNYLAYKLKKVA